MISPHGFAPFWLGIWTGPFPSPIVPQFANVMHFRATTCIYVYCETSTLSSYMVIHLVCLLWRISFCPTCPETCFAIAYGVEHWGQGVLHKVY